MNEEERKLDNSEEKSSWGGARPNSGRPAGSTNKATREQKEAEKYFKARVIASIDQLINSQMNLAQGTQMLFKIEWETNDKGFKVKKKPELVTSQEEIEAYLAGEYEDQEDTYYFITTRVPDNKAIDSLIDRVFGKAAQSIKHSGEIDTIGLTEEQRVKLRELLGYDKQTSVREGDNGDSGREDLPV